MWFLAFKHIFSRKQQTVLTFLAIIIGAAGYIVFSGIILGFQEYLIDRLVNSDGHIKITARDDFITIDSFNGIFFHESQIKWIKKPSGRKVETRLESISLWHKRLEEYLEVVAYADQLNREVIFKYGSFSKVGSLIGIEPNKQLTVTNFKNDITYGSISDLNLGSSLIFIGEDLIKSLGVSVNDTITVIDSGGVESPLKIIGTFKTGLKMIDGRVVYSSIDTVQRITKSFGEISKIIIKVKDVSKSSIIATSWKRCSKDNVESWDQANENYLSMITTQNIVRITTISILILIVSFGIYNILNMVVSQKKKDIAILRSIGFTEKDTIFLFLIQGVLLSIIGALIGVIVGWIACCFIETIKIPRGIGHMIISWDIEIYFKSFFLVVISSIIASYLPARAAGRLSPIDIIRGTI